MLGWLFGDKKPRLLSVQDQAVLPVAAVTVEGHGQMNWAHHRSLLEALEDGQVPVRSSCRSGNCGACLAYLRAGAVGYTKEPNFPLEAGEVLMCSCVPQGAVSLALPAQPVGARRRRQ